MFCGQFQNGQTNGRGFIGLAAMIFGNWQVGGLVLGAGLFGFMDAMQSQVDAAAHAILLVAAILSALLAFRALLRRRWTVAAIVAAVALGFFVWYASSDAIPTELIPFLPHLTTLAVLVFAAQRLRPPAADGQIFRRSPMTSAPTVDWEPLRSAAARGRRRGPTRRTPGLKVGAAALVDDGRIVVGCNVENASYGLSLCAECGLASALHASGGGRLVAISVVGEDGRHLAPCGRCRQVLWEVGGPEPAGRRPRRTDPARPSCSPAPSGPATCPSPATPAPDRPTRWPPTSSR